MILLSDYIDWARDHCRALGFTDEARAAEQFRLWFDVFGEFTLQELQDATRTVLKSTDQVTLMGQRAAILRAIHTSREVRLQGGSWNRAEQETEQFGVCSTCENAGILSVPHWGHVREGRWCPTREMRLGLDGKPEDYWHYHRVVVTCTCVLGQKRRHSYGDKPPMSLDRYERDFCPRWREELRQREREERAEQSGLELDDASRAGLRLFLEKLSARWRS